MFTFKFVSSLKVKPSMTKKQRVFFAILFCITLSTAVASLFLPYLVKLNYCCPDFGISATEIGYSYRLSGILILLILGSLFLILTVKNQIYTLVLSILILLITWLIRFSIHFQGFIDHNYDSKTGTGFLLLFISVLTHFVLSLIAFGLQERNRYR